MCSDELINVDDAPSAGGSLLLVFDSLIHHVHELERGFGRALSLRARDSIQHAHMLRECMTHQNRILVLQLLLLRIERDSMRAVEETWRGKKL